MPTAISLGQLVEHSKELCGIPKVFNLRTTTAATLYTGRNHNLIRLAVETARTSGNESDLKIISAGFGVVDENDKLPNYDATFSDMKSKKFRREWADKLGIPGDVRALLTADYDVGIVQISERYIEACNFAHDFNPAFPTLFFVAGRSKRFVPESPNAHVIELRQSDTKIFREAAVNLGGKVVLELAKEVAKGEETRETFSKDPAGFARSFIERKREGL
ncbi:MAG: hypothetical protein NUW37_14390 [Planctomycetes bacterium]|nr:hypothetical protein [Planctomycetota bacterium]